MTRTKKEGEEEEGKKERLIKLRDTGDDEKVAVREEEKDDN